MSKFNNWCLLPTEMGDFRMYDTEVETMKLVVCGDINNLNETVLLRIHSSCIASEVFGALDCDCADQLKQSMKLIFEEQNGIIIYLNQEGRGQGLSKKIKAMHLMQSKELDTVEAFECLNLKQDIRDYLDTVALLNDLVINKVRVITNNPLKLDFLKSNGIDVVEAVSLNSIVRKQNINYLRTKEKKLNHNLKISDDL